MDDVYQDLTTEVKLQHLLREMYSYIHAATQLAIVTENKSIILYLKPGATNIIS